MLTGVTLTGADDTVDPKELIVLSQKFPFVEWGLLIGSSTRNRFPSEVWFNTLCGDIQDRVSESELRKPKLSIHICGKHLRSILNDGKFIWDHRITRIADRAQLNFHGNKVTREQCDNIIRAVKDKSWPFKEVICQLDGVNDWVLDELLDRFINASGLHDCSHGEGVKPDKWPVANSKWKLGYAGGLGPDGLRKDVELIKDAAGHQDFWIDMETKLRDEQDKFDMGKCLAVLEEMSKQFNQFSQPPEVDSAKSTSMG